MTNLMIFILPALVAALLVLVIAAFHSAYRRRYRLSIVVVWSDLRDEAIILLAAWLITWLVLMLGLGIGWPQALVR